MGPRTLHAYGSWQIDDITYFDVGRTETLRHTFDRLAREDAETSGASATPKAEAAKQAVDEDTQRQTAAAEAAKRAADEETQRQAAAAEATKRASGKTMATAKCNDPGVLTLVTDLMTCSGQGMIKCSAIHVDSLEQLRALSNEEIKRRVDTIPLSAFEQDSASTWRGAMLLSFVAAKDVIKSVDAIPIDYNRDLKKYTCQAKIQYRLRGGDISETSVPHLPALEDIAMYYWLVNMEQNPTSWMLIIGASGQKGEAAKNFSDNMMKNQIETIKTNLINMSWTFTVQPKDPTSWSDSGTYVTLLNPQVSTPPGTPANPLEQPVQRVPYCQAVSDPDCPQWMR